MKLSTRLFILKIDIKILVKRLKFLPLYIGHYYRLTKIHIKYLPTTLKSYYTNLRIAYIEYRLKSIKAKLGDKK